jgi:hypothetical protein
LATTHCCKDLVGGYVGNFGIVGRSLKEFFHFFPLRLMMRAVDGVVIIREEKVEELERI